MIYFLKLATTQPRRAIHSTPMLYKHSVNLCIMALVTLLYQTGHTLTLGQYPTPLSVSSASPESGTEKVPNILTSACKFRDWDKTVSKVPSSSKIPGTTMSSEELERLTQPIEGGGSSQQFSPNKQLQRLIHHENKTEYWKGNSRGWIPVLFLHVLGEVI